MNKADSPKLPPSKPLKKCLIHKSGVWYDVYGDDDHVKLVAEAAGKAWSRSSTGLRASVSLTNVMQGPEALSQILARLRLAGFDLGFVGFEEDDASPEM